MSASPVRARQVDTELEELRARLREAEETLQAIRGGAVDAIVVEGPHGRQVFTLQGAEHPYRVLAETMNEGAASLGADGTVTFCNRRLCEILGVTQGEVLGSPITRYMEEEQRGAFQLLLARAREAPCRSEYECLTPRGKAVVLFSISPIGDSDEGICLVATDLTEQKKLERALENFAAQLSRQNDELSQFTYIASHDLQEPLRHIVSFGDMLREYSAGLSAEGADCAARMQKAARRMSELMEALLQYSRACGRGGASQAVHLGRVMAEVLLDLHEEIRQRKGRILVEALPLVQAVPLQMQHVLRNLVSNALKFQRPEVPPEIKIASRRREEGDWEISVQDNGIGFDSSANSRIFQPFQRLHKTGYPGTGMGLAICQRIIKDHRGTIWAESQPGRGSTFHFTVPAASERRNADDA